MVEHVERLRPNRQVEPFSNLEVLEQVQIHVEVVRSTILIAALRRIRPPNGQARWDRDELTYSSRPTQALKQPGLPNPS